MERDKTIHKTKIVLPFNHELRLREEVYSLTSKKLEAIGLKTLLFLKNIEEIKWQRPDAQGHYLKSTENIQGVKNARKVTIVSDALTEDYIAIERPIKIDDMNLKVEVAYKLGRDKRKKEIITSEPNSKLIVFFPTEKVTFLNFLIQGPYRTTPNRENIPMHDEHNKLIIEETGKLVAESIEIIKGLGYLDVEFLNILPISSKNKNDEIYSVIYKHVKSKLLENNGLLPTNDGEYVNVNDAALARGKDLTEFLDSSDLAKLFKKRKWLASTITGDLTLELRDYLINELAIKEINFEEFAEVITEDFLKTKSDDWMIDFYTRLLARESLWRKSSYSGSYLLQKEGILRKKPIIRLENSEHIMPFDIHGRGQVYLPSESKTEYSTVKRSLVQDKQAIDFLKKLGLTESNILSEIQEFILPKYNAEKVNIKIDEYLEDIKKVLAAYTEITSGTKEDFIKQFTDIPVIISYNYTLNKQEFRKPSDVYLNEEKLRDYFIDNDSIYFVSEEICKLECDQKTLPSFLQDIGVENQPKKIRTPTVLTEGEKELLRSKTNIHRKSWERVKDYTLEGLDKFLISPTQKQSIALWNILAETSPAYFSGEYEWAHGNSYPKKQDFVAYFIKILRDGKWLYDKDGNLKKPSELLISYLNDHYVKDIPSAAVLIKILQFKPDILEQLPEEYREKLEIIQGCSLDDLKEIMAEIENRRKTKEVKGDLEEENVWIPEVQPEQVEVNIEEIALLNIDPVDLKGQSDQAAAGLVEPSKREGGQEVKTDDQEEISSRMKKQIGNWGERYVFKTLENKFQGKNRVEETNLGFKVSVKNGETLEVIWLNKNKDTGKGCDLIIKTNGVESKYIEVKTKTSKDEELVDITGTQWEFARTLLNKGEGDKYSIYVVLGAGTSGAKIKIVTNPIKLWKEGKLYAHPVKFKL